MDAETDQRTGVVQLSAGHRLQWEETQQAYVLLYPEGMVTLNASAGEILKRCDGHRSVDDIVSELQACFPEAGVAADVHEFIEVARNEGWLRLQ